MQGFKTFTFIDLCLLFPVEIFGIADLDLFLFRDGEKGIFFQFRPCRQSLFQLRQEHGGITVGDNLEDLDFFFFKLFFFKFFKERLVLFQLFAGNFGQKFIGSKFPADLCQIGDPFFSKSVIGIGFKFMDPGALHIDQIGFACRSGIEGVDPAGEEKFFPHGTVTDDPAPLILQLFDGNFHLCGIGIHKFFDGFGIQFGRNRPVVEGAEIDPFAAFGEVEDFPAGSQRGLGAEIEAACFGVCSHAEHTGTLS